MNHYYNDKEESDSVYSYNYRDRDLAVHDGDYHADRDDRSSRSYEESGSHGYGESGSHGYEESGSRNYGESGSRSYEESSSRSYEESGSQNYHESADRKNAYRSYSYEQNGSRRHTRSSGFGITLIKCAVLAIVFGFVAGGIFLGVSRIGENDAKTADGQNVPAEVEQTKVSTQTNEGSLIVSDISDIVDEVMPSIVAITNISETEYYNWYGQSKVYDSESCGSGIIVAEDDDYLYIATNNHVVSKASSLTICFADESTVAAEIKGTDSGSDLAVVSVKKTDMTSDTLSAVKIAVIGDSENLKAGQAAIAIGNALGYGQSVTTGVISALDRQVTITDTDTGGRVTNELIQTDAAINPGNSGGALLNSQGEVIGINSVKYSDTTVEGMGYAIPMATASPIIDNLITREAVDPSQSAFLGIVGVDVTSDVASAYNMPEGIYIAQISDGSAAEEAGLQKGDILTSFEGHSVSSNDALDELLQYYAAGTKVEVVIQRANNGRYQEMSVPVTLGSKK